MHLQSNPDIKKHHLTASSHGFIFGAPELALKQGAGSFSAVESFL